MTYPLDNNQQLFAYLQAWRQLLEPLLTMAPEMPSPPGQYPPGTAWGMPPMPPYPPAAPPLPPPMSTDYTQQLFGQLQAWRQYLEQMTGARPGPDAPSSTQPSATGPAGSGSTPVTPPPGWPHVPVPPDRDDAGRASPPSTSTSTSNATSLYVDKSSQSPWPPIRVSVAPANQGGTQVPDDLAADARESRVPVRPGREDGSDSLQPAALARGQQIGTPPIHEGPKYGPVPYSRNPSSANRPQARPAAASPVSAGPRQVNSSATMPAARQSLFRGLAERAQPFGGG